VRFKLPSPFTPTAPAVTWLEWSADAFARARTEAKPVLLSITASWCHGCAVMDRVSYADAAIAETINRRFVPVRVDADRRPDVNERYNLEGWPTTAFLTPSGEMLTGTTYLPPTGLRALLEEVATAYERKRQELDLRAGSLTAARRARVAPSAVPVEPDLAAPQWIARRVIDECDVLHGGFGTGGKFLHVAGLRVALDEYGRTRDKALRTALTRTLDAMVEGQIRDAVDGGFFRYVSSRDWTRPHTEKMLEDQAGLLELYAEAGRVFEIADYQGVAREIMAYVHGTLASPEPPAFFASQAADESYYQVSSAAIRQTLPPPVVDRTLFTDLTARASAAWLRAGVLLGDRAAAEFGGRALDRLLTLTYEPGNGVAHWFDGQSGIRGLLTDQVHAAWALLALHDATGNPTWSMLAEELMRTALRTHWDESQHGFFDRVSDGSEEIGLMAEPIKPLATNCLASRVLARLSRLTGKLDLQEKALDTLRAQTSAYRQQGLFGAPYALAVADVVGS
jgi:uncharacterized protein YyaL (SSP411 family)